MTVDKSIIIFTSSEIELLIDCLEMISSMLEPEATVFKENKLARAHTKRKVDALTEHLKEV